VTVGLLYSFPNIATGFSGGFPWLIGFEDPNPLAKTIRIVLKKLKDIGLAV